MTSNVLIDTTAAAVFAMSLMLAAAARADQPNGGGSGMILFQPSPAGETVLGVTTPTPEAFDVAYLGEQIAAQFRQENVCADLRAYTAHDRFYDYRVCSNGGIYRTIPTAR